MKRWITCALLCFNFIAHAEEFQVISICDLSEQEIKELGIGAPIAVAFPAQTVLPISLFFQGDLLRLLEEGNEPLKIEIQKTFYVRILEEGPLFSLDLKEWKPLLEFTTGSISLTTQLYEGAPMLRFGTELSQRN